MDIRQALLSLMGRGGDEETASYLNDPATQPRANAPVQGRILRRGRGRPVSGYGDVAPMPPQGMQASRYGDVAPSSPGAYGDFAGYANNRLGLRVPGSPAPQARVSNARNIIPDAPVNGSMAADDNAAWQDARRRARASIAQEGYPYFQSPTVRDAGAALARSVDEDRALRAELARRQGVSWQDWWHFGGRQAGVNEPNAPAYRFGRAPDAQ